MLEVMPRLLPVTLVLILFGLHAAPAAAWGELGHRLVAALAEQRLEPGTRARALALLAADGADTLADVAGWADQVRDLPQYAWTLRLHFVNLPRDCSYDTIRDCREGQCIVAAVERFAAELADRALPERQRAEALKFLLHLVADLHQPLHAGFAEDLGGNRHQLSLAGTGTNLHALWDRELLASAGLDFATYRERLAARPAPTPDRLDDPATWARQSCALIDAAALYPPRRTIDGRYLERQRPLAEAQLLRAAVRLAALLEQALGGP
jgi:nuclease S1